MSHLRLVVDNTNVVPKQPFKQPVVTTRSELEDLRQGFDSWMDRTTIKRVDFEAWMTKKLQEEDQVLAERVKNIISRRNDI